jgi:hypothetical protein
MIRRLAIVVALLAAAPALAAEPWQQVDTAEFSIRLPPGTERSEQTVQTAAGDIKVIAWLHSASSFAVGLMYSDFPESLPLRPPELTLDDARDGALENVKAKLVREEKVTLEGPDGKQWPGRSFQGRSEQGVAYTSIAYLVGRRLYQFIAVHRADDPTPPSHAEMVASFKLKPAN